mmetsp:Transcript_120710/g.336824  ORF Transcript_120710/g.336824 Transcript_120710/m.336824 type:complete len:181 (-) Transcript_120710:81-623(-)
MLCFAPLLRMAATVCIAFIAILGAEASHSHASSNSTLEQRGIEAHSDSGRQTLSIAEVIQKAQEAGTLKREHHTAAKSKSPIALDMRVLQPTGEVPQLQAANIRNPELLTQTPSYGGFSVFDRQSTKGNPMVWTMAVVYGGLTVLVILLYIVWSDGSNRRRAEKAKPDLGLPVGYAQYVL